MSRPCLDGHVSSDVARRARYLIIDDYYDRKRASDRLSRFGVYLARRLPPVLAADPDVLEDPERWAAFVWATAAPPVMSPGYVTWADPVEDVRLDWDDYGNLIGEIVVRTRPPVVMTGWRGWDTDLRGRLVEPSCAERMVLSRTILRAQLGDILLPRPPRGLTSQEELVVIAKATVRVIAAALEDVAGPALARLAGPV